jgi:glutamate dehydrogenase (NADP+)
MPCATQNEIDASDAQTLIDNGLIAISEGANMPSTIEATELFLENDIAFGPGKAANAGGVATSGLEMAQNNQIISWTRQEVDERLHHIMIDIHNSAYKASKDYNDVGNYVLGANIAGFKKVAAAMMAQGHW